jgi:ABC-type transport system involved in multi-copper enzyme maturation permease subunit
MAVTFPKIEPFWTNPVIIRDMRVRMRGNRAFWNQGIYLALVALIASLGYAESTRLGQFSVMDPIAVQSQLKQFYAWIFETLAVMITLIAPALTAASVISERKLQTLDLLVTTPMTAFQMLSGKLISTIAFIILLLFLSIPASALCVILGGATIGDVFQSYLLLAIDGVLFSAIGLQGHMVRLSCY